ncbi:MAG: hypothetical protein LBD45_04035 [Bacteroidales bacterium]|jgi:hypothetical protein|nr:hypothetical protein [Bacteroidales bacterium]
MHTTGIKFLLILAAIIVTGLCVNSVYQSLHFSTERKMRERVVNQRMECIKNAQSFFYEKKGVYAANFDELVSFINDNQVNIHCASDSLTFIPFSPMTKFVMQTGESTSASNETEISLEIKAPFSAYLSGLNANEISRIEKEALQTGKYPGLRIRN